LRENPTTNPCPQAELDARLADAQVLNQKSEEQLQLLQSRVQRLRKQLEVQP